MLLAGAWAATQSASFTSQLVALYAALPAINQPCCRSSSRDISELHAYILDLVKHINAKYASERYQPIVWLERPVPLYEKIALYSIADVAVVTATRDGMNLVPYEYIVCRQGAPVSSCGGGCCMRRLLCRRKHRTLQSFWLPGLLTEVQVLLSGAGGAVADAPCIEFYNSKSQKARGYMMGHRAVIVLVPVLHLLPSSAYQHLSLRGFRHAAPYVTKQAVGWATQRACVPAGQPHKRLEFPEADPVLDWSFGLPCAGCPCVLWECMEVLSMLSAGRRAALMLAAASCLHVVA